MKLAGFERWLKETMGLDASTIGPTIVDRALRERMAAVGCADLAGYWQALRASPLEQQELYKERLRAHGVPCTEINHHIAYGNGKQAYHPRVLPNDAEAIDEFVNSIYFPDPDGRTFEFAARLDPDYVSLSALALYPHEDPRTADSYVRGISTEPIWELYDEGYGAVHPHLDAERAAEIYGMASDCLGSKLDVT